MTILVRTQLQLRLMTVGMSVVLISRRKVYINFTIQCNVYAELLVETYQLHALIV